MSTEQPFLMNENTHKKVEKVKSPKPVPNLNNKLHPNLKGITKN